MVALHFLLCFLGAAFATNAVPHFVSGVSGRAFQSPFADPPGIGLSSARANVLWGFANAVLAWLCLVPSHASLAAWPDALAMAAGALAMGLFAAHHFGPLHGGDRISGGASPEV
jgi:hypothetical protein